MTLGPRPALVAGVVAISWAAILIRVADAPPLAIAFWRMAIAGAVVGAIAAGLRVPVHRSWRGIDGWTGAAAALLLALHFGFWIASLSYTSVAASVALVSTQPAFAAVLAALALGERPTRRGWWGIGLAAFGSVVVAGADLGLDGRALFGDALALSAAFWMAGYTVVARYLRATRSLLPYLVVVYGLTAAWLLAGAALGGVALTGFASSTWLALAGLALGPTILGHTAMNYALRYLEAHEVNVAILGEPVGAALWAALLLGEGVPPATAVGGGLVLAGILLALGRGAGDEVAAANL